MRSIKSSLALLLFNSLLVVIGQDLHLLPFLALVVNRWPHERQTLAKSVGILHSFKHFLLLFLSVLHLESLSLDFLQLFSLLLLGN